MIKNTLNKLNIDIYNETLSCGLQVYIVPNKEKKDAYVTLTTSFGSTIVEFKKENETYFKKVPFGVAHFLEHKMFEQENNEDPEVYFSKTGATCNAYTDLFQTTYLFKGSNNLINNINYLLDFVYNPYFTFENVEKEKGIIVEEYKLYKDEPIDFGVERLIYNMFLNHPIKISPVGTEESINSITKDDLYDCYNAFYKPNNMILVITGNVDQNEAIEAIKDKMSSFVNSSDKIEIKNYEEPNEVEMQYEEIAMNVAIPKIFIGYKINFEELLKKYSKKQINYYFSMLVDIKLSSTSLFDEEIKNKGLINNDIEYTFLRTDKHLALVILAETNNKEKLINLIDLELKNINISEEEFLRKKKAYLSSSLYMSDNIVQVNDKIVKNVLIDGNINYDIYEEYEKININSFYEVVGNIKNAKSNILVINS